MNYKKCEDKTLLQPLKALDIDSTQNKKTSDKISPQDDAPAINDPLFTIFALFTGVAPLFIWNSILSLSEYWVEKFNPNIPNQMGFYVNIGALFAFAVSDLMNKCLKWKQQIIIFPTILTILLVVIGIVGESISDADVKTWIFLISCCIFGFVNNLTQIQLMQFIVNFGVVAITNNSTGMGLTGFLCASVSFILSFIPMGVTYMYVVYTALVIILYILMITVFIKFSKKYTNDEFIQMGIRDENELFAFENKVCDYIKMFEKSKPSEKFSQESKLLKDTLSEAAQSPENFILFRHKIKASHILANISKKEPFIKKINALKFIYPLAGLMCTLYIVTLGTFPAMTFITGIGMAPLHGFPLIILVFNTCDTIGRYGYMFLSVGDNWKFYTIAMFRNIFIAVFYALCLTFKQNEFFGSTTLSVILLILLSLSNGWLSSALFTLPAGRLERNEKKHAGYIMTFCLLIGLTYGSLVDALSIHTK